MLIELKKSAEIGLISLGLKLTNKHLFNKLVERFGLLYPHLGYERGIVMEVKEVKIKLYNWQIEALKKRGLKVSEVVMNLISIYLMGDLNEIIAQTSILNESYELGDKDKLDISSKEFSKILNQISNMSSIKNLPISIKAYDEKIVQTILSAFDDVNNNPSKLTSKVYDVQKAVMIRLYKVVPNKLGYPIPEEYVDYLIQTDERLKFLRPFIIPLAGWYFEFDRNRLGN